MHGSKNKSLSAESELKSAYEFLYQRDFKACMRIIKKKMPKLKSAVDKAYFNILKLRVLKKLKKTKEEKELLSQLVKEFLENEELYSDQDATNYFKNYLRNNDELKAAQDIFESQYALILIPLLPSLQHHCTPHQLLLFFLLFFHFLL